MGAALLPCVVALGVNRPWALSVACLVLPFSQTHSSRFRASLLASALGLDVFITRLWFAYGASRRDLPDILVHCRAESWEVFASALAVLAVLVTFDHATDHRSHSHRRLTHG